MCLTAGPNGITQQNPLRIIAEVEEPLVACWVQTGSNYNTARSKLVGVGNPARVHNGVNCCLSGHTSNSC